MHTATTVTSLFSRKLGWRPQGDDFLVEGFINNNVFSCVVTLAELKLVEPKLLDVLPLMLPACREAAKRSNENVLDAFPGSLIRHTLLHWADPKYLIDADGLQRPYYELADIVDYDYQPGSKSLSVEVSLYQTHEVNLPNVGEIPLVVDLCFDMVDISTEWMNQQFPGWETRMQAALSIGYLYRQLNDVVFVNEREPSAVALSDVRFE